MANPIGPLLSGPQIDLESSNAKAAALFGAALFAVRVAPSTLRPLAKYGLGIEVTAAPFAAAPTPLAITNLAPQPFGFVPPVNYGLEPNFYLPGTVGAGLPSWIPGAAEQTALVAQQQQRYRDDRAASELERFAGVASSESATVIQGFINQANNPADNASYVNPAAVVALLQAELLRRQQVAAAEAAARASTTGGPGGSPDPTTAPGASSAFTGTYLRLRSLGAARRADQINAVMAGDP